MQRADVARFFILYHRGGIYAALDTFPNIDRFPKDPLGLRKMLARETKTMCKKREWEIEVVMAEKGNYALLQILQDMKVAFAEKEHNELDFDQSCRLEGQHWRDEAISHESEKHWRNEAISHELQCSPCAGQSWIFKKRSSWTPQIELGANALTCNRTTYSRLLSHHCTPPPLAAPMPRFVHQRPPPPLPHECNSQRVTGLART